MREMLRAYLLVVGTVIATSGCIPRPVPCLVTRQPAGLSKVGYTRVEIPDPSYEPTGVFIGAQPLNGQVTWSPAKEIAGTGLFRAELADSAALPEGAAISYIFRVESRKKGTSGNPAGWTEKSWAPAPVPPPIGLPVPDDLEIIAEKRGPAQNSSPFQFQASTEPTQLCWRLKEATATTGCVRIHGATTNGLEISIDKPVDCAELRGLVSKGSYHIQVQDPCTNGKSVPEGVYWIAGQHLDMARMCPIVQPPGTTTKKGRLTNGSAVQLGKAAQK